MDPNEPLGRSLTSGGGKPEGEEGSCEKKKSVAQERIAPSWVSWERRKKQSGTLQPGTEREHQELREQKRRKI